MEEKDLQTGDTLPETPVNEVDTQVTPRAVEAVEMSATDEKAPETPAPGPKINPSQVSGTIALEKPVIVSDFMRPGQLFDDYEITNQKELPMFMRVFAASALFHLFVFALALQLPAVVEKTCDSTEFTQQLCDTIYVASLLSNAADAEYVDKDYEQSEIPDANSQDVTFISSSDFTYPEGYWALQDEINGIIPQDDLALVNPTYNPNDYNSSPSSLNLGAPAILPGENKNAVTGNAIDSPFTLGGPNSSSGGTSSSAGSRRSKRPPLSSGSPNNLPPVDDNDPAVPSNNNKSANSGIAQNTPKPVKTPAKGANPDVEVNSDGYEINKRVLKDFGASLGEKVNKNEVDISAPFAVVAEGILGKDGKFDLSKTVFIKNEGDEKMVEVAKEAIEALNKSGWLGYLKALGNKKLSFSVQQDQDKISVVIQSEVESEESARQIASGLNVIISFGKGKNKGTDEGTLLENAIVTNQGNTFVLNFSLPQNIAQPMIRKKLAEAEAEAQKKSKSQGIAVNANKAAPEVK